MEEGVKGKTARDVGKVLESGSNFLALIAHCSFRLRKHARSFGACWGLSMSVEEEKGRVDMWIELIGFSVVKAAQRQGRSW